MLVIWRLLSASCVNLRMTWSAPTRPKATRAFAKVLDDYAATLTGAKTTLENKRAIVAKLKQTLFGCDTLPLRTIKPRRSWRRGCRNITATSPHPLTIRR